MNLQFALIAIGAVVVAGIYFYSRWEAPRSRHKRLQSALKSPAEPSFSREEPDFIGEMDADYEGASDEDSSYSSFSVNSNLDADSDAEELTDHGVVEEKYSRSVDLSISDESEAPPQASGHHESLDGDILSTEIPVLEARVDTAEAADIEPDDIEDNVISSVQDSPEPEPEPELDQDLIETEIKSETEADETEADETEAAEISKLEESAAEDAPLEEAPTVEAELFEKYSSSDPDPEQQHEPLQQSYKEHSDHEEGSHLESNDDDKEIESEQASQKQQEDDRDAPGEKSSLRSFLGSFKQISWIKDSIQQKLETVKSDREKSWREQEDDTSSNLASEAGNVPVQRDLLGDQVAETEPIEKSNNKSPERQPARQEPSLKSDADTGDESRERLNLETPNAGVDDVQSDVSIAAAEGFEKLSQIDYYVKLSGDRDVSRESVLAIYREAAAGLSKNHSIYGLRMPDKVWRDLENEPEESRFGDLVITIQLADQNGPVTEHDMTRFSALVMKLSESTGRGFAFMAPIESAHQQAQAIEKFRKRFDSIFVVNIRPLEDEMFEGAVIERCATQIGLTPDTNNFYARYKPVGKQKVCLYSLANMSDTGEFDMDNLRALKTRGVTFFTRPAVNRSPGAVFSEMVDAAKAFASRIKGEVIAPGYDGLSMEDAEAIRKSIEIVASEMESYGIIPGSEEATRLF